MPSLFISYKRGTLGIVSLVENLRAEHYRVWFDKDDIHTGENWRTSVARGVDACDALLVCLTPAASHSEFVQYEVKRALEQKKPIFPLKLEAIDEAADPQLLGLTDIQFIDFTTADSDIWDKAFKKLLEDLRHHKPLKITTQSKREQRGTGEHARHQHYLKKLVERIGTMSLASISPDANGAVRLEDVYIDLPTNLSLSIEVQDWHVIRWGFATPDGRRWQNPSKELDIAERKWSDTWWQAAQLGLDQGSFEALIGDIDAEIATYREAHPGLKPDGASSWRNDWNNGIREDYLRLQIQDIAAAASRLVILGQPGSGKSTFVRHLAICLAGEQIEGWERPARLSNLLHWIHGELTPIYIELRHFVVSKHFPSIETQLSPKNLWNYIEHEVLGAELADYLPELKSDVEMGRALLIFDGLDEVPYPDGKLKARQQQLISLAQVVNNPYFAKVRVIFTSRPYAYQGWTLPEFKAITITDFQDNHRIALATKLYQAAGMSDISAHEKASTLNRQLSGIDPQLKDRPLFLTLMATVYLRGNMEGLPTRRGTLYRQSILLLLDRWTQGKIGIPSLLDILGGKSLDELYERLTALAYEVHSHYGEQQDTPEIDYQMVFKHLKPLGKHTAVDLINYLSVNAGVLVSPGQDEEKDVFHFAHRTFQEYLAAAHLTQICIQADNYKLIKEHIRRKPQLWRVPATLAGDILANTGRKREQWALIGDLLEEDVPEKRDSMDWWLVWLAGQIAREQDLHIQTELSRLTEKPIRDALVAWLVAVLEREGLRPIERADCGRVLASLGDPRTGVGLRPDGLPDVEWGKDIPKSIYKIGGDEEAYPSLPAQEVRLNASYRLAKYPITMTQFQAFLDDQDTGFNLDDWWKDFPNEYKKQEMAEQNNPYANHPRDSVSWYQAVAFCRWLTKKYQDAGLLRKDWEIRLPSEHEWEIAARYPDEQKYPYGNESDISKMNTYKTRIDQTSAVGMFPSGANNALGLKDMCGNVWEWCLTDYYSGSNIIDQSIAKHPEQKDVFRVLRGGAFSNDINVTRAASRNGSDPYNRIYNVGFRTCAAPTGALLPGSE